jgi:hypothetical protein
MPANVRSPVALFVVTMLPFVVGFGMSSGAGCGAGVGVGCGVGVGGMLG